jgi:hypothetical protein
MLKKELLEEEELILVELEEHMVQEDNIINIHRTL